ncbi:MAG: sigma-70 family RNA polymerase sigma factor [Actinobacteria bacterium]|nr:sigma-70 family RNA polymerase sigma factor [Actinomycetota bacterium]MCI0543939.1 sigma-70 family RNA polymerase sigma factor [Actinomycetota bacterium]
MTTPSQDARLLGRVAEGDHGAFTEIMRTHEDRVFAVCLRILADRELALDATQDTFLSAFRKAGQFQGQSALGTWLYRIAVNTCYDQLRRARRRPTTPMPEHVEVVDDHAEQELLAAGHRHEIVAALRAIPVEFRAAVVLADIEGLALPEVALALGVPVGTVKSRVFRGRRLLAQLLGEPNEG